MRQKKERKKLDDFSRLRTKERARMGRRTMHIYQW